MFKRIPRSLTSLYWDSLRPVKFLTIPLYAFCAIGMVMRRTHPEPDLVLLFNVMCWQAWTIMCFSLCAGRLCGLFFWGGNTFTKYLMTGMGIFVWSMLFASSSSPWGMGSLYLVAATFEAWIMARVLHK